MCREEFLEYLGNSLKSVVTSVAQPLPGNMVNFRKIKRLVHHSNVPTGRVVTLKWRAKEEIDEMWMI